MFRTAYVGTEQLIGLGGQVLQPVLPAREHYHYFRGLHLGSVLLNYMEGVPVLNAHAGSSAHFSDSYEYALTLAKSQTAPQLRHVLQFSPENASRLSDLTGENLIGTAFPAIVVGLDPSQEILLEPGPMEGKVFQGYLTVDDIDPYSREVLTELLPRV